MIVSERLPRRALTGQLLYGLLWIAMTLVGLALRPSASGHGTHEELGLPPCPSAAFMDRPCPGCGLTTSISAFLHGDLRLAFHAHLLGPFFYLFVTVTGVIALRKWTEAQRFDVTGKEWTRAIVAAAVVFLTFGIWRMAVVDHYSTPTEKAYIAIAK